MSKTLLPLCLLLAVACGSGENRDSQPAAAPAAEPAAAAAEARSPMDLGIRNARLPQEGLLTGGQLTREQMTELAEMGYTTFVNLRPAAEDGTGWEEEFAAEHDDWTFLRIPVADRDDLNRANAELLEEALDAGGGGSVVYCQSGNRVGALLALKARWLDGVGPEEALGLGREAGMTRLEAAVEQMLAAED